jgi:PiT family inorganic phosphate transporter
VTITLVIILVAALAAANGANDVSKGVATLAGAGVTRYRTAIVWGTITTLVGCLFSLTVADKLTKLFSSGIVTQQPDDGFTIAVLVGTIAWVAVATATAPSRSAGFTDPGSTVPASASTPSTGSRAAPSASHAG